MTPEPFRDWRTRFSIRRGVYLLPSLFTLANLMCGFYSIVLSFKGEYLSAALAIVVAFVADALDGRIARLTGTATEFGVEFDSLADLATFCVSPAVLVYSKWLYDIPKIGWVCAFVYVACGAIRLARFNAYDTTTQSIYFNGLPSPAAAGGIVTLIFLEERIFPGETHAGVIAPWVCILLAFLMVSSIHYPSFKNIKLDSRVSARTLIAIVFFIFIFVSKFYVAFAALFVVYLLAGLVVQLSFLSGVRAGKHLHQKEEAEKR